MIARFDGLPWRDWAAAELARHDPAVMLSNAAALGRFSSEPWIREVDVPTAVIVPTADRRVPSTASCGWRRRSPVRRSCASTATTACS